MDDCDNGEIAMKNNYEQIHFEKISSKSPTVIADDLAFIMENAAIREIDIGQTDLPNVKIALSSTSGTDDSDSSSNGSDVKIMKVEEKSQKRIISVMYIDSSSEEENTEHLKTKQDSNDKENTDKVEQQVVHDVLDQLVSKVAVNCDDGFISSDSDDAACMVRNNLAAILREEEKVVDAVPKVKNEVLPEELPEDEEVITLKPEDNLLQIGWVSGVVENMIVIEADKTAPALDADTAFFIDHETFLGKVFDTFGPVKNPFYSVRLSKSVDSSKLTRGTKVYFVPFNQDIAKYVFVEQLKKLKGSDASWKDDCEPPAECVDYSDDEEERKAKSQLKQKRRNERMDRNNNESVVSTASNDTTKAPRHKRTFVPHGNPLLEHAQKANGIPVPKWGSKNQLENPTSQPTNTYGRQQSTGNQCDWNHQNSRQTNYSSHGPQSANQKESGNQGYGAYYQGPRPSLAYQGPSPTHHRPPDMYQGPPLMYQGLPPPYHQGQTPVTKVPPPVNQGPPNMNQGPPPMNQRSPYMNQGPPPMNQGSPHMNQRPPHMNQGPPPMHRGSPHMNQGSPHMNQGSPHMNQRPPPMNQRPPPMKQGSPPVNPKPPPTNQGPPHMKQGPPPMNQGSPHMNQRPPPMNQGPPSMNQGPPQMNQGPPSMNHEPETENTRPLLSASSAIMNQGPHISKGPQTIQPLDQYLNTNSLSYHHGNHNASPPKPVDQRVLQNMHPTLQNSDQSVPQFAATQQQIAAQTVQAAVSTQQCAKTNPYLKSFMSLSTGNNGAITPYTSNGNLHNAQHSTTTVISTNNAQTGNPNTGPSGISYNMLHHTHHQQVPQSNECDPHCHVHGPPTPWITNNRPPANSQQTRSPHSSYYTNNNNQEVRHAYAYNEHHPNNSNHPPPQSFNTCCTNHGTPTQGYQSYQHDENNQRYAPSSALPPPQNVSYNGQPPPPSFPRGPAPPNDGSHHFHSYGHGLSPPTFVPSHQPNYANRPLYLPTHNQGYGVSHGHFGNDQYSEKNGFHQPFIRPNMQSVRNTRPNIPR